MNTNGVNYRCVTCGITKSDAIRRLNNCDLDYRGSL